MAAAVVGATEPFVACALDTDGCKGLAEGDVGGLTEGHAAAGDGIIGISVSIDDGSQIAQVLLNGNLVGGGASLVGSGEEIAAEGGAQLRGVAAPVARGGGVGHCSGRAGEDNVLQLRGVEGVVGGEGYGVVVAEVDALEFGAVLEGSLADGGHGGQGDLGHLVAVIDGALGNLGHAAADGNAGNVLRPDEGKLADARDAVAYGDAGQRLPAPRGLGTPEAVDSLVLVVIHFSRSADGQAGVVAAVVLVEVPCGVGAARAANGLQRGGNGDIVSAEGHGGALLVGSHAAARRPAHAEGHESRVSGGGDGRRGVLCAVGVTAVGVGSG